MDPVMWWLVLGVAVGIAVGEVVTLLFRRSKEEPPLDQTLGLKLTHAETESANWKQKCFDLQAEAARSKERTGLLEAENEKLRKDYADQSEAMLLLKTGAQTATGADEAEQARGEAERARSELDRVIRHLDEARQQLMLSQDEGARLQNEIDGLNQNLADSRRTIEELHGYKAEADAHRQASSDKERLEEELATARRRIELLEAQTAQAEEQGRLLETVRQETESARESLDEKTAALQSLQEELDAAREELRGADTALERASSLEQELTELKEKLVAVETSAERSRQETVELRRQIEEGQAEVARAQELRTKAETLEKDVESLRMVSASKDQAVAESIENLRRIEAQLAYRPSAEEVSKLQAELDARRSTIEELQEQIERSRPVSQDADQPTVLTLAGDAVQVGTPPDLPVAGDLPETSELEETAQEELDVPLEGVTDEAAEAQPGDVQDDVPSEPHVAIIEPESEEPIVAARNDAPVFEPIRTAGKDPLIQIIGIGHLYERKLRDAGVQTFADLAAMSPDRILEIIQPAEWQRIEPERWIEDAAKLSAGA